MKIILNYCVISGNDGEEAQYDENQCRCPETACGWVAFSGWDNFVRYVKRKHNSLKDDEMNAVNSIEREFHHAMIGIYERASDTCDYRPIRFLQMVQEHGGLETAKRLLSRNEP